MTNPTLETCWRLELLLAALGDVKASCHVGGGTPFVPEVWKQQIEVAVQSKGKSKSPETSLGEEGNAWKLKEGHRARA